MKVRDIMTREVQTCTPDTSLTDVARLMWEGCCGIIPIVDARGAVAGIITDRDISMALVASSRKPVNIAAQDVMVRAVHGCGPDDDLHAALAVMKRYRVRRLPVIDGHGALEGILSIDDVIVRALASGAPTAAEIVESLREILQGLQGQLVSTV
jgi:CBS domain-containing protein